MLSFCKFTTQKNNSKIQQERNCIKMNKQRKGFSKKLLIADYIITIALAIAFFVCTYINGRYTMNTIEHLIELGIDVSCATITPPFSLDTFGIFFSAWIGQLGISSAAYFVLVKSERKMQLPMMLINELPQDIKDNVDMTEIITTVLTSTEN